MPIILVVLIIVVAVLIVCFSALLAVSKLYYHRSVMATLAELYLRITEKEYSDEQVVKDIVSLPLKNDVKLKLPKSLYKKIPIKEFSFNGVQVFDFIGGEERVAIIYLHGGGYVRQPRKYHYKFACKLAKKTGSTVRFVIYKKAPNHSFLEAFESLTELYLQTRKDYKRVILSGDSSGGGLAMALCEEFLINDVVQPEQLILLSPWVDISLDNPKIEKYQKTDPIVFVSNEKIWGKCWARGESVKSYKVSPIYGRTEGLAPTVLFVGTREVLYPDIVATYEKLKKSGVQTRLIVGRGLNHVYPIYPIPEATQAVQQITDMIKNNSARADE